MTEMRFKTFQEFWPFYLGEHSNPLNRRLHFVGTTLLFALVIASFLLQRWILFAALPVVGYGFAWVGHFVVEKNRPATFKYPLWSIRGDFTMFFMMLTRRLPAEIERLKHS